MLRIMVTCFALVSVLFLGKTLNYADQPKQKISGMLTGTLQKMIVENGSVTMNVDLNGLNGVHAAKTFKHASERVAARDERTHRHCIRIAPDR